MEHPRPDRVRESRMTFNGPWDFAFDQPLGKQCFRPEPFRCWYTRVTGIRQSVRLEGVGEIYPTNIRLTASFHGDIAAVQEVSLLIDRHGKRRINRQKQGRFFLPFVIADDEREVFAVNVILSCSPLSQKIKRSRRSFLTAPGFSFIGMMKLYSLPVQSHTRCQPELRFPAFAVSPAADLCRHPLRVRPEPPL